MTHSRSILRFIAGVVCLASVAAFAQRESYGRWELSSTNQNTNLCFAIVPLNRQVTSILANNDGANGKLTLYTATNRYAITNAPSGALTNIPADIAIKTLLDGTVVVIQDAGANLYYRAIVNSNFAGSVRMSNDVYVRFETFSANLTNGYIYAMHPLKYKVGMVDGVGVHISGEPAVVATDVSPVLIELVETGQFATNQYLKVFGTR